MAVRSLAGYRDAGGRSRELLALPGYAGSVLVLDRDAMTLGDRRLVAHLAADEPFENAELICRHYLKDARGCRCRQVCHEDLRIAPLTDADLEHADLELSSERTTHPEELADRYGCVYRLHSYALRHPVPQLRWSRTAPEGSEREPVRIGLRDVVAAIEDYEPACTLTKRAIDRHERDPGLVVRSLRSEIERLHASPIVLNRGLREAVLAAIDRRGTSMSEIALRCGVVKRDRRGRVSGETSWLARRIGLMPEGGASKATPWIHIDVLATIAREGLGICPHEVELH